MIDNSIVDYQRNDIQRLIIWIVDPMACPTGRECHISGINRDDGSVVVVLGLAGKDIIYLSIALMYAIADS